MSTETWLSMIRCRTVWRHGETRRHNRTSESPPPQPHNNTTTIQQPHNNHTTTTQQPHNNRTTAQPHNRTTAQPHSHTATQPHNHTTTPIPTPTRPPPPPPPPRARRSRVTITTVCGPHFLCLWRCERVGAAKRRRERRLRSWAKHERTSVAVALAENLHHSRQKVEGGAHEGPRTQNTVRATGARPGVLTEPEPQGRTVTDGYVAVPVPSLAGAAGEAVDSSSLRYFTAAALRQREEEERQKELEEREEAKKRADEMQSLLAAPRALRTPAQ